MSFEAFFEREKAGLYSALVGAARLGSIAARMG